MGVLNLIRTKPAAMVVRPRSVPRVAVDGDRMFDLAQTARLEALFTTPRNQRGAAWIELLYRAVRNASLAVAPAHSGGPDGLPCFKLGIPASWKPHP